MKTLEIQDLQIGKIYHIRNGFAKFKDELWFNNSRLVNIEIEWSMPTMLTFILENGSEIVIDGDFVTNNSNYYQIINRVA
jgi:hypothetical protein